MAAECNQIRGEYSAVYPSHGHARLMSSTLGCPVLAWTIAIVLSATPLRAQQAPPACPAAEAHRFDFLIGNWHGHEYLLKSPNDSAIDDALAVQTRKLPFGCAFEERTRYTPRQGPLVEGVILLAFDLPSKSWRYSLADNYVELATFDGVRTDSGWAFFHDLTTTTPLHRLRFQWVPTPTGYTQTIQVSTDSGRSWPVLRHLNFTRDANR
jgi:hypothetical protein